MMVLDQQFHCWIRVATVPYIIKDPPGHRCAAVRYNAITQRRPARVSAATKLKQIHLRVLKLGAMAPSLETDSADMF